MRIILIMSRAAVNRIILSCPKPPKRRGPRELHLPGIGVVRTTKPIDHSWNMRSFKIVERKRTVPGEREFEIHINKREKPLQHVKTGVIRGRREASGRYS